MNKAFIQIRLLLAVLFAGFLIFPLQTRAQDDYPQDYFRSPVDFTIYLSGTFGELRSGHFHSGMDIKTGGVPGKNIYAVGDGYVSRIKVSAYGFGKTLYVTHPNGYISVYAHLSRFNDIIGDFVKKKHYATESFELNLFPGKDELPVKKGEVIAYSGNSGGSNGPHLHFEMRLEATQTPVNPLLFGFEVKDYIRPKINWLKVIPSGPGSLVNGKDQARVFRIDGWGEQHRVKDHDTIRVAGPFSLAVHTWDKLNGANNKNGVYAVQLFADDSLVYEHELEKFDFVETRYINSLIDYYEYKENQRRYQRTEIDPNNHLSIYGKVKNSGILYFDGGGLHRLEYVIRDFSGNISRLPIVIRAEEYTDPAGFPPPEGAVYFSTVNRNAFSAENISMEVPGSCLYRDLWFEYSTDSMPEGAFSRVHRLHTDRVPVHKHFSVQITPDSIPDKYDKLLLARITDEGEYIPYLGEWRDTYFEASLRSFGDFVIVMDTIPPEINSVNIASGIIKKGRITVKVKIDDDLSGIRKYRATLNGAWLLMEYDAKNRLLTYFIDDRLKTGENDFQVEVSDQRGNTRVFRKTLTRK